jgi:hypothetical protein
VRSGLSDEERESGRQGSGKTGVGGQGSRVRGPQGAGRPGVVGGTMTNPERSDDGDKELS